MPRAERGMALERRRRLHLPRVLSATLRAARDVWLLQAPGPTHQRSTGGHRVLRGLLQARAQLGPMCPLRRTATDARARRARSSCVSALLRKANEAARALHVLQRAEGALLPGPAPRRDMSRLLSHACKPCRMLGVRQRFADRGAHAARQAFVHASQPPRADIEQRACADLDASEHVRRYEPSVVALAISRTSIAACSSTASRRRRISASVGAFSSAGMGNRQSM